MAHLSKCVSLTSRHIFPPVLSGLLHELEFSKFDNFVIGISMHAGIVWPNQEVPERGLGVGSDDTGYCSTMR